MNKRKYWNIWLIVALVCGFSLGVTSCSDDDDNGKSEEQKQQEAQQKASKFWDVVGQLVADDVTEDYANKTFEPTYGNADPNDPQTRIVNTNDMKTAAKRFADLVGTTKVDENTTSYTYRDDDVGELIYTKGDGTTAWATVDVRIKQLPHLSRIIYRKAGEGENGKFDGKAYYRFGDVVKRTVQIKSNSKYPDDRVSIDEYWICVRPAFGPEGKEDSHWVCVNTVANNNVKYYRSSDKKDYWLPTNLKENKEQMQNFAELLYAICNPEKWYENANNFHVDGKLWGFDGVPIFHDFSKKYLPRHNALFWNNVQRAWRDFRIYEKALLLPSCNALSSTVNSKHGIHLLYKGYSWWFSSSWDCELWEAIYTNGDTNEEKNMHHEKINDGIEHSMQGITFDCRTMGNYTSNYMGFFDNDAHFRWTIRHAKGSELDSDGKLDVNESFSVVDCTPVYSYYNYYEKEYFKQDPSGDYGPEVTEVEIRDGEPLENVKPCDIGLKICVNGHIHDDSGFKKCDAKRVAVVAYVGNQSNCPHGLGIALEDVMEGNCDWINTVTNTRAWGNNHQVLNATWRVPTVTDWYCITNGGPEAVQVAHTSNLMDIIKNAEGKLLYDTYWSGSIVEGTAKIWLVRFDMLNGEDAVFVTDMDDEDDDNDEEDKQLRAVLVF